MAITLKIKRNTVAGTVPTTSDLTTGELGVNLVDRKIYVSNGTVVIQLAGAVGSNTQIPFNDSNIINASAAFVFDKTSNTLTLSNTAVAQTYQFTDGSFARPGKGQRGILSLNVPQITENIIVSESNTTISVVNAASDYMTASGHTFVNNDIVQVNAVTYPGGLAIATNYYIMSTNTTAFQLSTSYSGSAIDITSAGANVYVYKPLNTVAVGPVIVQGAFSMTISNGSRLVII